MKLTVTSYVDLKIKGMAHRIRDWFFRDYIARVRYYSELFRMQVISEKNKLENERKNYEAKVRELSDIIKPHLWVMVQHRPEQRKLELHFCLSEELLNMTQYGESIGAAITYRLNQEMEMFLYKEQSKQSENWNKKMGVME